MVSNFSTCTQIDIVVSGGVKFTSVSLYKVLYILIYNFNNLYCVRNSFSIVINTSTISILAIKV